MLGCRHDHRDNIALLYGQDITDLTEKQINQNQACHVSPRRGPNYLVVTC